MAGLVSVRGVLVAAVLFGAGCSGNGGTTTTGSTGSTGAAATSSTSGTASGGTTGSSTTASSTGSTGANGTSSTGSSGSGTSGTSATSTGGSSGGTSGSGGFTLSIPANAPFVQIIDNGGSPVYEPPLGDAWYASATDRTIDKTVGGQTAHVEVTLSSNPITISANLTSVSRGESSVVINDEELCYHAPGHAKVRFDFDCTFTASAPGDASESAIDVKVGPNAGQIFCHGGMAGGFADPTQINSGVMELNVDTNGNACFHHNADTLNFDIVAAGDGSTTTFVGTVHITATPE